MMKRVMFFSLALVLALAGMVSVASAAPSMANTSQKGSLLIWPKIMTDGNVTTNEVLIDTIVYLSNDCPSPVNVKCYWVDEDQNVDGFEFRLTAYQPVLFSAFGGSDYGTGGGVTASPFQNKVGELKCWAVNSAGDTQISFNHLYGGAWIRTALGGVTYSAWSFRAIDVGLNQPVGVTQGKLELTGTSSNYDACPQYIVSNFTPAGTELTDGAYPDLTLVPCKEDLRQDRIPTCTKAKFDIWNANEVKLTGAYQCIKCWYEGVLEGIGLDKTGFGGNKFSLRTLKTYASRFRVTGVASSVCNKKFLNDDFSDKCTGGQVNSPFVAVMLYGFPIDAFYPITGYTPHGAGADGSGFVLWDIADPTLAPRRR
jgi:hypothetical protein